MKHSVDEKPVLAYGVRIEEKDGTSFRLVQKVTCQSSDPFEYRKSSASFQNEQRDNLLQEESNDDGRPYEETSY